MKILYSIISFLLCVLFTIIFTVENFLLIVGVAVSETLIKYTGAMMLISGLIALLSIILIK